MIGEEKIYISEAAAAGVRAEERNRKRNLSFQASEQRIDSISDSDSESIQNQIINIRYSGSKGQLKNLNTQGDEYPCLDNLSKTIQIFINDRQYNAAWDIHRYVTDDIPYNIPDISVIKQINERNQIYAEREY